MSDESSLPAWIQAGAAVLALGATTWTFYADRARRESERRLAEKLEMRRTAFDALGKSRKWLLKVKAAQGAVPADFNWQESPDANRMAGIVQAALDPGLHMVYPNGSEILPLKTAGTNLYHAIEISNTHLAEWNNYEEGYTAEEDHVLKTRKLEGWLAEIREPLEYAVDGMEKIVNSMRRGWD